MDDDKVLVIASCKALLVTGTSYDWAMSNDLARPERTVFSCDKRGRAWNQQCDFVRRDGTRCSRFSIRGGFQCPRHGGSLPNVKKAASARLARLAPPAVMALEELLSDASPPAVRLRTAKYILRLTGVDQRRNNPHARSNLPGPKSSPQVELSGPVDIEIEALLGALLELEGAS
jgi:hypothetical protein